MLDSERDKDEAPPFDMAGHKYEYESDEEDDKKTLEDWKKKAGARAKARAKARVPVDACRKQIAEFIAQQPSSAAGSAAAPAKATV